MGVVGGMVILVAMEACDRNHQMHMKLAVTFPPTGLLRHLIQGARYFSRQAQSGAFIWLASFGRMARYMSWALQCICPCGSMALQQHPVAVCRRTLRDIPNTPLHMASILIASH